MRVCPKSKNLAFLVDVFPQTFYHGGFFYAVKMNTKEIWKPVAECNGEYYVSSWGRVKSFKFGKERILKHGHDRDGYHIVSLCRQGKAKSYPVHKLVALLFIENPDNKPQVNHIDTQKSNNHIDNLEWSTCKENVNHAWANGLCESTRKAISKANSKPVIDVITNKQYNSLTIACKDIGENYKTHAFRIFNKSKLQRFYYITDGKR